MDAAVAVGAAGGDVDFADQSGQLLASELPRGGGCALVFVVVLPAETKDFAAAVYRCPGVGEPVDHRVDCNERGWPEVS